MVWTIQSDDNVRDAGQWRNAENYAYVKQLPPAGCAWEFLRRNPDYKKAWLVFKADPNASSKENSGAAVFGLLRFASPERDARTANVFWHPGVSREVLRLIASRRDPGDCCPTLPLNELQCRMTRQSGRAGEQHILFAEDGRFLQLEIQGLNAMDAARLSTEIVLSPPRLLAAQVQGLRRLADIVSQRCLRACFYPPDKRASRFSRLLQVLDGWSARASYREMALAIFGDARVSADWHNPHLRDHLRRALRSGTALMLNGYRRLLK
jgi:hypothetical protein